MIWLLLGLAIGLSAYPMYLLLRTLSKDMRELWNYLHVYEEDPYRRKNLTWLGWLAMKTMRLFKGKNHE